MNTGQHSSLGALTEMLVEAWQAKQASRAFGGLWALSGFAYQSAAYLLRFFRRVDEQQCESGDLAQMERLSDILCPEDGRVRLIQVKRTLTRSSLVDAVREAYEIMDLCVRQTPALGPHLCFQIACRRCDSPLSVRSTIMAEVKHGGSSDI